MRQISRRFTIPSDILQNAIFVSLSLILFFSVISLTAPIPAQIKKSRVKVGKQVWAVYSGDWGNNLNDGEWRTWSFPQVRNSMKNFTEPPVHVQQKLYPALGLYSSHDPSVLRTHLRWAHQAGIDALIFEWWGETTTKREGYYKGNDFADKTLKLLLSLAPEFHIKIAPFIMAYEDEHERNNQSFYADTAYLWKTYGADPAILHLFNKPVFGIYEPHGVSNIFWAFQRLKNEGIDPFWFGSYRNPTEVGPAVEEGINALFTHCAADGATAAANSSYWQAYGIDFKQRGLLFIPTVAPGADIPRKTFEFDYVDKHRSRDGGEYYDRMWRAALKVKTDVIAVASFNAWRDASNIEPPVDREGYALNEETWSKDKDPDFYIKRTKYWIDRFKGFE